jgi:hypothetical protein
MKMIIWIFLWWVAGGMPALADAVSEPAISVPAAVITLPRGEYALLVEKQTQRFYVYGQEDGVPWMTRVFDAACSTGEAPGPKQVEGDKKTPEGIYFVIDEHLEKDLTPIYGPRAFPTDYPHLLDRQQGKTGYAIWIHGTDKPLKAMDTNGCIALENKDVRRLSGYVTRLVTPVIIQQTIQYADPREVAKWKTDLTGFVNQWIQAHLTGTAEDYQAFYLPESLPDSREWKTWEVHRQKAVDSGAPFQIKTSGMGIYRHVDMFVVTMDVELSQGAKHFLLGRRRLFVQIRKNMETAETFLIAGDEFQDSAQPWSALGILAAGSEYLLEAR